MRLLILAVFALFYVAPCEEGAGLLASKSLLNGCAVEDGTLQHLSYAAGSGCGMILSPPEAFGVVSVMFSIRWLQITGYILIC
uniref:Uncharacterized protein n=1 Tax=Strix occidentalis caurina TaxID=311401 RepID=A0A8D0KZ74_STROC